MVRRTLFVGATLSALLVACATGQVIISADAGFEDPPDSAAPDAVADVRDGGRPDANAGDAANDVRSDVVVIDAPSDVVVTQPGCLCTQGCGSCPNVAVVTVGNYRIDSVEATNLHYQAFLASNPTTQYLPAACAQNVFTPAADWPAAQGKETHPVVNVDWCDAYAYCRWVGKRLCGAIGGGANTYTDNNNSLKSQWYNACTGGGTRAYPYGGNYAGASCNGVDMAAGTTKASGATAACVGGYPSLFDMSGNVWEWEDSCNGAGANDQCRIRGGSYQNSAAALSCGADASLQRMDYGPSVGIRCCAP